jgi:hypothetical protein
MLIAPDPAPDAPVVDPSPEVPRSLHLDLDEIETFDKDISTLREVAHQHELEVDRLKIILRGLYDRINEHRDARGEKVKTLILKLKQVASK